MRDHLVERHVDHVKPSARILSLIVLVLLVATHFAVADDCTLQPRFLYMSSRWPRGSVLKLRRFSILQEVVGQLVDAKTSATCRATMLKILSRCRLSGGRTPTTV